MTQVTPAPNPFDDAAPRPGPGGASGSARAGGDASSNRFADAANDELVPLVYAELRRLAGRYLAGERRAHTLQPTALVHEAFLRLADRPSIRGGDREAFLAVAAQAMRRVLVDHARRRGRLRRGGGRWQRVTIGDVVGESAGSAIDLVELDDLIERLARMDPRGARVVELRYFGGLSIDETAAVLGVSSGTVDNDWYAARAWLRRELSPARDR